MTYPQPAPSPAPKKRRKWPWVLGAIAALIVAVSVSQGDDNPEPVGAPAGSDAPAVEPAAPAEPVEAAPTERTVVYKVTGTGTASMITYNTDGMTTTNQESDVPLPWEKTITLPAGEAIQMVSILAQGSGSGSIDVEINVDGKLFKEAHAEGYGIANASGNIGSLG